jgi:hypothetical protein
MFYYIMVCDMVFKRIANNLHGIDPTYAQLCIDSLSQIELITKGRWQWMQVTKIITIYHHFV